MFNLLKRLSGKHQITLLSFLRDPDETVNKKELSFLRNIIAYPRGHARQFKYLARAATSSYPWLYATYDNARMRKGIETLMGQEKFDLIHIEPGYVWPSIPNSDTPIVVSEHNIEHTVYEGYIRQFPMLFLRPLLYLDVLKMKYWEERVWQRATKIVTVSENDRDVIARATPQANISVVPNGVDIEEYSFHPRTSPTKDLQCLFVGDFRWFPNIDAAKWLLIDIWPAIQMAFSNARLTIVGRGIPPLVRSLSEERGIGLKESVPAISKEYRSAHVLLAPLRIGGGTKFKILEAMASGLPVITTKRGIQGLLFEPNKHVLVADTVNEYVRAIGGLVKNKNVYQQLAKSARSSIEKHYSWDVIAGRLDNAWKETNESRR